MKHLKTLLIFFFLPCFTYAQDCETWFPFNDEAEIEMTYYDKKGKISSINAYQIIEANYMDEGLVAVVKYENFTDEGEEISEGTFQAICDEGMFKIDLQELVTPSLKTVMRDMEIHVTGDQLIVPPDLEEGMELEDARSTIALGGENSYMKLHFEYIDRKVTGKEHLETKVGAFDAYIVEQTLKQKIGISKTYKVKEWYVKGMGVVKSEYYSKKGKLMSSAEITKYKPGI